MSSIDHLHNESKMLQVRTHNKLLSDQFAAATSSPQHPNHHLFTAPPPPRLMKMTLKRFSEKRVARAAADLPPHAVPAAIKRQLHTRAAKKAATSAENVVLGHNPPNIASEEKKLTRTARTRLAQLRSGFSRALKHYLHRIDPATPDVCPNCHDTPHDTKHLFNCIAHPTILKIIDLWTRPVRVANEILPKTQTMKGNNNIDDVLLNKWSYRNKWSSK
jgi:hypothetical protein